MYQVTFKVLKNADGTDGDPRAVEVGVEGVNIVDAICFVPGLLPKGTEIDILSAKIGQVFEVDDPEPQQLNEEQLAAIDEQIREEIETTEGELSS